jgi:hypothetical protein
MDKIKSYKRISKNLAQIISLSKMYKPEHPMVKQKMQSVYEELRNFFNEHKQSIVLAKSADMLLMNGEKMEVDDRLMAKFVEDFTTLDIGSIELELGLDVSELELFVTMLKGAEKIVGAEKIKEFLAGKKAPHLIARAATFKLVQENEDIVKKGEFIKVDEIPPDVLKKFTKDFAEGKVGETLKSADKDYKHAAHNSTFLAGLTFDLIKDHDKPEDLEKILWLLADYLVDEIGTAKEEEINREVLEEIKKKLLSRWKDDSYRKRAEEHIEKTYSVINVAMELKRLLALYKKHRGALEKSTAKIRKIMRNLPTESQLYRKTAENLAEIGPLTIDWESFK